jgi:type I restriction enzyme M protein
MAIKKTELYRSLWESCDVLRGSMDASQYKDYILTLLFVKYVSDKAGQDGSLIDVPEGAAFADMVKLKGKTNIGEGIQTIIDKLAEENHLKKVINSADFNNPDKLGSGKDMVDRLSKLIGIFEGLVLGGNHATDDDLLGDAYEYLMRHFAVQSGKSKGQFYTPSEVSQVLAKIIGITARTTQDKTVYDPTCGSGSLLLKVADQAPNGLTLYGQENDNATTALAKMNMILHENADADIQQGNTLANPLFLKSADTLETFDFVVANPPFSNKQWTNGVNVEEDPFERFAYGVPPSKNGDYAFLLHILKSLKSTGKAAVILPHGVLFRGNAEADIRQNLVKQGYIKGIIGLPANLFYGTGIPACIIVLDKEDAHARKGIFMVDASKGFIKDGNKNRLRSQDIHQIVDVFTKQGEVARYSRMVTLAEIAGNGYNLNIPRYIDASEPEDIHDLDAHLQGGIPQRDLDLLEHYWQQFPTLRKQLFQADTQRPTYFRSQCAANDFKRTILAGEEYQAFADQAMQRFAAWRARHVDGLKALSQGIKPKDKIRELSEDLLLTFTGAPLLDKYAVYQILMDYWTETFQDDVYMLALEGWSPPALVRLVRKDDKDKDVEKPDLVVGSGKSAQKFKMDFIAPSLMIEHYFAAEQAALDALQQAQDEATQALTEHQEEHGGEEGVLRDVGNKADADKELADNEDLAWKAFDKAGFARYEQQRKALDALENRIRALEDEPVLADFKNAKGKIAAKDVKERLTGSYTPAENRVLDDYLRKLTEAATARKTLKQQREDWQTLFEMHRISYPSAEYVAEIEIIETWLTLLEAEGQAKKAVKEAQEKLNQQVLEQYGKLDEFDMKVLMVDKKWLATLEARVRSDIERMIQQFANRLKQLHERYAQPLPTLEQQTAALSATVAKHLQAMGLSW